jgi:DNA-nicking Smr family endonuclease
MKSKKAGPGYRPFENLDDLIKRRDFKLAPTPLPEYSQEGSKRAAETLDDDALFQQAMADVHPIQRNHVQSRNPRRVPIHLDPNSDDESETLKYLRHLVETGHGFVISQTPEYIEGRGRDVPAEITRRLHDGRFTIQAHVDLHGMGVPLAKATFDRFMNDSIAMDRHGVLIVHGRGLSSSNYPVLKYKVHDWLSRGYWRRWVIAFTSARSCDGGTGATYVLLRHRPRKK